MQCTVHWPPTGGTYVAAGAIRTKEMEEEEKRERRRRQRQKVVTCCKKVAAFLFSHIGLAGMVVAYSIMGGFLFQALEGRFEKTVKLGIISMKEKKIEEIWQLAAHLNPAQKDNFTQKLHKIFVDFQGELTVAVKEKGWDGKDETDTSAIQWSFAGALLYAVTVITTIGYGHVAPKTIWGRLVTILYALVGIPLTFLYLSNIGNFLADCFRLFYKKICCDICCCQKCERQRKQERLRMKRRRELAQQRNIMLSSPTSDLMYTTTQSDNTSLQGPEIYESEYVEVPEPVGLPGGHRMTDFVTDQPSHPLDTCDLDRSSSIPQVPEQAESLAAESGPIPSPIPSLESDDMNIRETAILDSDVEDDGVRETAILDDENDWDDDVRETAILDDDTDEEHLQNKENEAKMAQTPTGETLTQQVLDNIGDAKETDIVGPQTPSSEAVASEILDHIDGAKETDILDDSQDQVSERGQPPKTLDLKPNDETAEKISFYLSEEDVASDGNLNSPKDKSQKDKTQPSGSKKRSKSKSKKDKSKDKGKDKGKEHGSKGDHEHIAQEDSHKREGSNKESDAAKKLEKSLSTKHNPKKKAKEDFKANTLKKEHKPEMKSKRGPTKDLLAERTLDRLCTPEGELKRAASARIRRLDSKKHTRKSTMKPRKGTSLKSRLGFKPKPSRSCGDIPMKSVMSTDTFRRSPFNASDDSFVTARSETTLYQDDGSTDELCAVDSFSNTVPALPKSVSYCQDATSVAIDIDSPLDTSLAKDQTPINFMDDPFDYEESISDEKVTVPISVCLILIAGYIFAGSVLFTLWEEWDYLTGSYFCFITLSTIGFGDIVPGTDMKEWASSEKLVLCALWLAFGLSLLAMCFNLMQEEVKEKCKWLGQKLGLLRDDSEG